jgi:tRNA (cmo5U34)-methyltransferase
MQSPPISQAEIAARISSHLDELLELWWAEQGASKPKDLELIASAIPFPRGQAIRALDLCCGPGDVGRAIRQIFPMAQIDCIDRDPFLTSVCRAVNQRDRIPGRVVVRDLKDDGWLDELSGNYDVVATVNALHWFDTRRARQLIKDVHGTLRGGGIFLLAEPASPETPFAAGVEEWKARQPPRYTRENWERFWSRANGLLGYDHTTLLGPPHVNRIGDGMSVAGWMRLLERAGFKLIDVLLRDADQVVIGAVKSIDANFGSSRSWPTDHNTRETRRRYRE